VESPHDHDPVSALGELSRFRHEFHACLTARADALFGLTDAVLCADGPVTSLVDLTWWPSTAADAGRCMTR